MYENAATFSIWFIHYKMQGNVWHISFIIDPSFVCKIKHPCRAMSGKKIRVFMLRGHSCRVNIDTWYENCTFISTTFANLLLVCKYVVVFSSTAHNMIGYEKNQFKNFLTVAFERMSLFRICWMTIPIILIQREGERKSRNGFVSSQRAIYQSEWSSLESLSISKLGH